MRGSEPVSKAHSFWFDRFQVQLAPEGKVELLDRLAPPATPLAAAAFDGLAGRERDVAYFVRGFAPACMSAIGRAVADRPAAADDELFWQYPCRTEGAAWEQHRLLTAPLMRDGALHVYLGLPWASWIDFARKDAWSSTGIAKRAFQLQMLGVRLSGLRGALQALDVQLRVHTVCQHIYWQDMMPIWRRLGVSDAWLSHCPEQDAGSVIDGVELHPWSLFAVNACDPARKAGLVFGKDPAEKNILASFIGANGPSYLGQTRNRLSAFAQEADFTVRMNDSWHFEEVVYSQQIGRQIVAPDAAREPAVASYNAVLSDSVFSLCPAGTGPNSLRLWESLAIGSVPVLLGPAPALPCGGSLLPIDWDQAVLRIGAEQIDCLPNLLRSIPLARVRHMQKSGMAAYAMVNQQRCF